MGVWATGSGYAVFCFCVSIMIQSLFDDMYHHTFHEDGAHGSPGDLVIHSSCPIRRVIMAV